AYGSGCGGEFAGNAQGPRDSRDPAGWQYAGRVPQPHPSRNGEEAAARGAHRHQGRMTEILSPGNFAGIRRPLDGAETLPPWCYTAPEFFRLEMERIFSRSWIFLGHG